jgi:hypothetical protein
MPARILLVAIVLLIPDCAAPQTDAGPAPDVAAIQHLIDQYANSLQITHLTDCRAALKSRP